MSYWQRRYQRGGYYQDGGMPRFPMTGLTNAVQTKFTLEGPQEVMYQKLNKLPFQPVPMTTPSRTNYSFSYPNPQGGQSTTYFPDLGSYNEFMKDRTYTSQQIAGDKSSASATGYYQSGGTNLKYQADAKEFLNQWSNSPMGAGMLMNSLNNRKNKFNKTNASRLQNLANTQTVYDQIPEDGTFQMIAGSAPAVGDTVHITPFGLNTNTHVHEYSHMMDRKKLPKADNKKIKKFTSATNSNDYLSDPTEVRARLNELRYFGKERAVYDPFNQKFSGDLNSLDSGALKDLRKRFSDEEITNMLNSISKTNTNYIPIAQDGGTNQYPSTSTLRIQASDASPASRTTKRDVINDKPRIEKEEKERKLAIDRKKDDADTKEFLRNYYEYASQNVPFYSDLSKSDSFDVRWNRGAKFKPQLDRLEALHGFDKYGLDSTSYYMGYPEFIKNPKMRKALEDELKQGYEDFRRQPLNDLMKPDSLRFEPKPRREGNDITYGQYDPKTNITWVNDETRANTLVHERSHKADRSKLIKGLKNENQLRDDLMNGNLTTGAYEELKAYDVDYLLDFSERQARHRTTQYWLNKNYPGGYDPRKPITDKEYEFLQANKDKLPSDVKQLFSSYGGKKDLYLKYINSFQSGGTNQYPSTSTLTWQSSDSPQVSRPVDPKKAQQYKAQQEQLEQEREQARKIKKYKGDPTDLRAPVFQFPDGSVKTEAEMNAREKAYVSGRYLGSIKMGNWTDYINPTTAIGSMAEGLGTAPYEAKRTNSVMPYVTGIGTPLAAGAIAGAGAKTSGQFVNNILNPVSGSYKSRPGNKQTWNQILGGKDKAVVSNGVKTYEPLIVDDEISKRFIAEDAINNSFQDVSSKEIYDINRYIAEQSHSTKFNENINSYNTLKSSIQYWKDAKREADLLGKDKIHPNFDNKDIEKYINMNTEDAVHHVYGPSTTPKEVLFKSGTPGKGYAGTSGQTPFVDQSSAFKPRLSSEVKDILDYYKVKQGQSPLKIRSGDDKSLQYAKMKYNDYINDVLQMNEKKQYIKEFYKNPPELNVLDYSNLYPKSLNKRGGMIYQQGGITPQNMQDWNGFIDFLEKEGYKGNPALDVRDKNLSKSFIDKYNTANPKSTLRYEMVPQYQQEFVNYRQKAINDFKAGKAGIAGLTKDNYAATVGEDFSGFWPEISSVDGWLGSKTSKWKFPTMYVHTMSQQGDSTSTASRGLQNANTLKFDRGGIKKYQAGDVVPLAPYPGINPVNFNNTEVGFGNGPDTSGFDFSAITKPYKRQFDPFQPNMWGYGLMGANLLASSLLNKSNDRHYEAYKRKNIRDFSIPSMLQDPLKFGDDEFKDGGWISGAVNPAHKGYCTPMSKETCTPRRKAFARRAKAHFKEDGGMTLHSPEDQGQGYFKYPDAAYLNFPGKGTRTFVPGPFPLMVKDDNGYQMLTNKPIKTKGYVTEMPMYEEGGEVRTTAPKVSRKDATIEAEKGELILGAGRPGSIEDAEDRVGIGLYRVGGQLHSKGGTPLKAYPGDFVFSNTLDLAFSQDDAKDLIGKEIKKKRQRTPAKLAEKYMDLNKHLYDAQNKELDPVTKKTAIYNVNNFMNKLADIAYAQEEKKGFPTGLPEFAQASLAGRGFDTESLQASLSGGMMRMGGQVPKFQQGAEVTLDQFKKAKPVRKVPNGYKFLGNYDGNQVYIGAKGDLVQASEATTSKTLAPSNEKYLKDIIKRDPNLQYLPAEEVTKKGWGNINDPLWKIWDEKYYKPRVTEDYVFTQGANPVPEERDFNLPFNPNSRFKTKTPTLNDLPEDDEKLKEFYSVPNNKFNVTLPEAYGLWASNKEDPSRYPTAFRNYEIQNAKSLINNAYKPSSPDQYLNAIRRSQLGASDNQGNFAAALNAQTQAIAGVRNENEAKRIQQAGALANLEVQDGIDRITNFEKYDSKLETLAYNKALRGQFNRANTGAQLNAMGESRETKSLFNVMSDYYQINPDNTFGLKPTYTIKNGRLEPYQRNMADLIRQAGVSTNEGYLNTLEKVYQLRRKYGINTGREDSDIVNQLTLPGIYR